MNYKILITALISCLLNTFTIQADSMNKRIILITIDGLRLDMITKENMPTPVLKEMAEQGTLVERVVSVAPAITYPNHTSLITGARPVHHGIFYNSPFQGNQKTGIAYWFSDSIKCPTLWKIIKEQGGKTCSLFWPVSTFSKDIDLNIPEYWSIDKKVSSWDLLRHSTTPLGLIPELEQNVIGHFSNRIYTPGGRNSEAYTAFIASYIIQKYKPILTTIHLWSTDESQHNTGTESIDTKKSVEAVDYAIGQIKDALARANMLDNTIFVISGDHGFTNVDRCIVPNLWLKKEGLLTDNKNKWQARFHCTGSTAFLYLNKGVNHKVVDKVRNLLNHLPVEKSSLFRIVEKNELDKLGCDPRVELAIEPIVGVSVSDNMKGEDIIWKNLGRHGYISPRETTSAIFWGKGIRVGNIIHQMKIEDIAPTILRLIGIDFKVPDGKVEFEIIRK